MSSSAKKFYSCFNCPRRVQQKDRHSVPKKCRAVITKLSGRTPGDNDYLCNKCRCMCYYHLKQKEHPKHAKTQDRGRPEVPPAPSFSPPSVTPCTSRGHAMCCICKRPGPKLVVVPVDLRHRIFLSNEIIIPAGSRCCPNHLQQNINDLNPIADTTTFNKTSITQLIKFLRSEVLRIEKTRLDFWQQWKSHWHRIHRPSWDIQSFISRFAYICWRYQSSINPRKIRSYEPGHLPDETPWRGLEPHSLYIV